MSDKWIQNAHLHKGAFTKKANKAGQGVQQYAKHVIAEDHAGEGVGAKTLKQAILARTFAKMRK